MLCDGFTERNPSHVGLQFRFACPPPGVQSVEGGARCSLPRLLDHNEHLFGLDFI